MREYHDIIKKCNVLIANNAKRKMTSSQGVVQNKKRKVVKPVPSTKVHKSGIIKSFRFYVIETICGIF